MTITSIPLTRVVALNVPLAWYEAVAIALGCAEQIAASTTAAGLDSFTISTEGAVAIRGVATTPFTTDPLHRLVTVLLGSHEPPRELSALLQRPEPHDEATRAAFARELAYFGRPDRAALIASVAVRALAKEAEAARETEFARLRESASASVTAAPQAKVTRRRTRTSRRTLVAAGGAGMLVAAGLALSRVPVPSAAAVGDVAPVAIVSDTIDHVVNRGLQSLGLTPSPTAAVPETPAPPRPPANRGRRRPAPVAPSLASSSVPEVDDAMSGPADDVPTEPRVDEVVAVSSREESDEPEDSVTIYHRGNADVRPPVLTRAQVRSEGTPGAVAPSSIEVLVDEYGNVERVRLQPARWSVHERMLVSAVKAWRFHPALKDGKPVKYAMRIAVPREHGQ